MGYKADDIVICSNNKIGGHEIYDLIVGDKYLITGSVDGYGSDRETLIWIKHIKSGKQLGMMSSNLFISLEVFREFKLIEILK